MLNKKKKIVSFFSWAGGDPSPFPPPTFALLRHAFPSSSFCEFAFAGPHHKHKKRGTSAGAAEIRSPRLCTDGVPSAGADVPRVPRGQDAGQGIYLRRQVDRGALTSGIRCCGRPRQRRRRCHDCHHHHNVQVQVQESCVQGSRLLRDSGPGGEVRGVEGRGTEYLVRRPARGGQREEGPPGGSQADRRERGKAAPAHPAQVLRLEGGRRQALWLVGV